MESRPAETIQARKGIGIWGNTECVQCGACCYEYNKYLYECNARESEQCENFEIKDRKAYCLAHEGQRKEICGWYFCGNAHFNSRFSAGSDKILRQIAEQLGTAPKNYKIPVLMKKDKKAV